jgi:hypothetical protein
MWIDCFVRFHREQAGKWVRPREMNPGHVEQFLTHPAVERHVAASRQNQASGDSFSKRKGSESRLVENYLRATTGAASRRDTCPQVLRPINSPNIS